MRRIKLILLLINVIIVAILVVRQRNANMKALNPATPGKEVKITELPSEVKSELETLNKQNEKRLEKGHEAE